MNNIKLMTLSFFVFFVQLLFCTPLINLSESVKQELKDNELQIISNVNNEPFSLNSKTVSVNDKINLSVALKLDSEIIIPPFDNSVIYTIRWYKVEEANGDYYSNTDPSWHWDEIPYKETEVVDWRDKFKVSADVTPTVFKPVYCNGNVVGTMRYKATLTINGEEYSTPGKETKHKGSISKDVHRISMKGNTSSEVINYALAMCNLPYIWGSESHSGDKYHNHQAELFIGADCADFCVAAHQFAGKQLPYDSIKYLTHTKIIAKQLSIKNGNYLNAQNQLINVGESGVQIGYFVYWGTAHVGLYFADKSDPDGQYAGEADGIFNQWDLVLHTLFAEPKIESIMDITDYGKLTVYQFKE